MSLTLPTLIIFCAILAIIYMFHNAEKRRMQERYRERAMEKILPTRMQAYERMTIYLERINPEALVVREQMKVQTAGELYAIITNSVKQELEHNVAQQIYISANSWARILRARDEVLKLLRDIAKELPPKAPAVELGRRVIEQAHDTSFYVRRALEGLRSDINGEFIDK